MNTKYTFILPAFKAKFLSQSITSILNQTYIDFKLIVSDDCSPEDLKSIVDSFSDNRVIYRRNQTNIGGQDLVAHWNLLVDLVESEYFILASDDDLYEPDFLMEIDKLASKYQKVDQIRARVRMINEEEEVFWEDLHYEEYQSQLKFCAQNPNTCIANNVFRTSAIKSIGGFINFPLAWGTDFATEMALSRNGVANTDKVLFTFRQSGINISSLKRSRKVDLLKLDAVLMFDDWAKKFIKELSFENNPLNKAYYEKIIIHLNDVVISQCISSSWAMSIIRHFRLYIRILKGRYLYNRSKLAFTIRFLTSKFSK